MHTKYIPCFTILNTRALLYIMVYRIVYELIGKGAKTIEPREQIE